MNKTQEPREKLDLAVLPHVATQYITNVKLLQDVWQIMSFGAMKYGADNWRETPLNKFTGAALRHQLAKYNSDEPDPDTGLPHAAHLACNCVIIIEKLNIEREALDLSIISLGHLAKITCQSQYQVASAALADTWIKQLQKINRLYPEG